MDLGVGKEVNYLRTLHVSRQPSTVPEVGAEVAKLLRRENYDRIRRLMDEAQEFNAPQYDLMDDIVYNHFSNLHDNFKDKCYLEVNTINRRILEQISECGKCFRSACCLHDLTSYRVQETSHEIDDYLKTLFDRLVRSFLTQLKRYAFDPAGKLWGLLRTFTSLRCFDEASACHVYQMRIEQIQTKHLDTLKLRMKADASVAMGLQNGRVDVMNPEVPIQLRGNKKKSKRHKKNRDPPLTKGPHLQVVQRAPDGFVHPDQLDVILRSLADDGSEERMQLEVDFRLLEHKRDQSHPCVLQRAMR